MGFTFAVSYNLYLIVAGAAIFSLEPPSAAQHGLFTFPYNVLLALTVGFVEETVFRGYILRNLCKAYSYIKAIVYSSITYYSTIIFIGSMMPFSIAAPQIYQHILGITFYIMAISTGFSQKENLDCQTLERSIKKC